MATVVRPGVTMLARGAGYDSECRLVVLLNGISGVSMKTLKRVHQSQRTWWQMLVLLGL